MTNDFPDYVNPITYGSSASGSAVGNFTSNDFDLYGIGSRDVAADNQALRFHNFKKKQAMR